MSRSLTGHMITSSREGIGAKRELQERWKKLELKPATLLHLQEVLDTSGVTAAAIVTDIVEREKEKQIRFATIGKEWGVETLRLLSLEGLRPHLMDVLRFVLESFLTWHLIALPSPSVGILDHAVEITLAALFLLMSMIVIGLTCWFRNTCSRAKKRRKSA